VSIVDQYSVAASGGPTDHVQSLVLMTALMYVLRLVSLVALVMAVFAERPTEKQITSSQIQNAGA
jgi:hypothetical protein